MSDNFYLDNPDLRFRVESSDLSDIVAIKEKDYSSSKVWPTAPRDYADAQDNWRIILEILGEICATIIAPRAAEADEEGATFDKGVVTYAKATQAAIEAFRKSEILGCMLPWEYGGLNLPETVYQAMIEMVSRAEGGLMTIFGLQEIAATINEFADESIKKRVLPRFSRGEVFGAMVLTEPDAGSDLGSVQCRAFLDAEGKWRVNGVKRFITNGNADIHLVLARSEDGTRDARGLSMFLIEKDETVRVRRIENKLGIHSSPTCELQYSNSPAELVGKRRFGLMRCAMALMNGARLAVAAQALGIAEAAYREALRYAGERAQFGKTIAELPAVSRMLVSMKGEIEAARALIFETSRWVDVLKSCELRQEEDEKAGKPKDPTLIAKKKQASNLADMLTPLSKYYASESGNRVAYKGLQIHGGVGYMKEFNAERHVRDVRITNIYEGTSQLQVVAALGKMVGRGLDPLFDQWAALDFGGGLAGDLAGDLADVKARLSSSTELFKGCCDKLHEQERDVVDYFGSDLMDMAAAVFNSWLLLRDARGAASPGSTGADAATAARKADLVRAYCAEHLPRSDAAGAAIMALELTAILNRQRILGFS
jgi:hypothetical protein